MLSQISQREHVSVFRVAVCKKGAVVTLSALITLHIFRQFLSVPEVSSVLYYVIIKLLPLSTQALVNQVAATVQNRFTKNLPNGEALCGVFTRDYRHDALNCQVGYIN